MFTLAFFTALKHARPSEKPVLPVIKWVLAQRLISSNLEALTTFMSMFIVSPSAVNDTATTNGVLLDEPRPFFPPRYSLPQ
jgi:hypothetical protein